MILGVSVNLADLAPFVRASKNRYLKFYKDNGLSDKDAKRLAEAATKKEIKDAVQLCNYQSRTLVGQHGQSAFWTLFIYLNGEKEYKQELIDLALEFFRQRVNGMPNADGINVTQAFPKILMVIDSNNYKPGTKYWYVMKAAIDCSSKRLTPDYVSEKKMLELKGAVFSSMGCRSWLSPWHDPQTGELVWWGRPNGGVVSINLPDVAFASGGDENTFFRILDDRLELARKTHQQTAQRLAHTPSDVAPLLWQGGVYARLQPGETLENIVYGGYMTWSIGYIGCYETSVIMTGKSNTSSQGKAFELKVLKHMTEKAEQFKQEDNLGYGIYGTPSESYCKKAAETCMAHYPEQYKKLFNNKDYLENSYHVSSQEPIDPFSKIELEGEFARYSLGGQISYIEATDISKNLPALYPVIECIYDNIMYCEINIVTSYCRTCGGRQTVELVKDGDHKTHWECRQCGETDESKMDIAARTCGLTQ